MAATTRAGALPTLTGLRGVAALAVFGSHIETITSRARLSFLHHLLVQGFTGVSFFFILSGFVLGWSHRSTDGALAFWRRRFARVYPAYAVALVLAIVVNQVRVTYITGGRAKGLDLYWTFGDLARVALLLQAWWPVRYFAINGVTWSLSCEVFFYALGPLLIPWLLSRSTGSRRGLLLLLFGGVVAVAVFAVITTTEATFVGSWQNWLVYIFPPVRLMEFAIGVLLVAELRSGTRVPFWPAVGLAGAAYLLAGWLPFALTISAVTVAPFALLVIAAAGWDLDRRPATQQRAGRRAAHRAYQLGGRASYAFYLTHSLVLGAIVVVLVPRSGTAAVEWSVLALAASAAVALGLYTLVEVPAEGRLRGARPRAEAVAA